MLADGQSKLYTALKDVVGDLVGVHYQPPQNLQLKYPCVIYEMDGLQNQFADNLPYAQMVRYSVTVMDKTPDSVLWTALLHKFQYVTLENVMNVDGIYHWNFTLYY